LIFVLRESFFFLPVSKLLWPCMCIRKHIVN
jgi:hypothetical protein